MTNPTSKILGAAIAFYVIRVGGDYDGLFSGMSQCDLIDMALGFGLGLLTIVMIGKPPRKSAR